MNTPFDVEQIRYQRQLVILENVLKM